MTKNLKKILLLTLASAMILGAFSGCKPKDDGESKATADTSSQDGVDVSGLSDSEDISNDVSEDVQPGESTASEDNAGTSTNNQTSSKANASKSQSKSDSSKGGTTSAPVVEVPAFSEEKKEDLGGYELNIKTLWANEWQSSKTNNGAAIRAFETTLKNIETDYNCKIKITSVLPEKMLDDIGKAAAAGDLYADIIQANPTVYYNMVTQKKIVAINDLPELNASDTGWMKTYKDMTTFNNKFYGITWINKVASAPLRKAMFFNKDLMSQYGQPDIYAMVQNGTWTWEAWENIMKDVKSKSSNKVFGIGAYDQASLSLAAICSNSAAMYSEKDGKFSYTGDSANAVEAMDFMKKIIDGGLYSPFKEGFWVDTTLKDFTDSKVLFYVHDYYAVNHIKDNMKAKYGVVPFPRGTKAENYSSHYGEGQFMMFMAGNKNQSKAAKVMFAIAKRTNNPDWIKNEVSTMLTDSQSGEMLKYLINNPVVDCTPLIPQFSSTMVSTLNKICKEAVSPKTMLSNAKMTAQTNLNDFFKQK